MSYVIALSKIPASSVRLLRRGELLKRIIQYVILGVGLAATLYLFLIGVGVFGSQLAIGGAVAISPLYILMFGWLRKDIADIRKDIADIRRDTSEVKERIARMEGPLS